MTEMSLHTPPPPPRSVITATDEIITWSERGGVSLSLFRDLDVNVESRGGELARWTSLSGRTTAALNTRPLPLTLLPTHSMCEAESRSVGNRKLTSRWFDRSVRTQHGSGSNPRKLLQCFNDLDQNKMCAMCDD